MRTPKLIARTTDQATRDQGRREDGTRTRRLNVLRAIATALIAIVVIGGSATAARAQRMAVKHYTNVDGLPQAQVLSVFQDRRGYMWFGTYSGVARFDGGTFVAFTTSEGLIGNVVTAIGQISDGRMIFGTDNGVSVFEDGLFQEVEGPGARPIADVRGIHTDPSGEVWLATPSGLFLYAGGEVVRYSEADGLPSASVFEVMRDRGGYLWVGTERGLARRDGDRFIPVSRGIPPSAPVRAIVEDDTGLWIGTEDGIYRSGEERFDRVEAPAFAEPGANFIIDAVIDRFDAVWIATRAGTVHSHAGLYSLFTHANGFADANIWALAADREGHIWFGTDDGASKFVPGPFTGYTDQDGLPSHFVRDLAEDEKGRIWAATRAGVAVVEPDGRIWAIDTRKNLSDGRVYSVAPLPDGSALFGTRVGLIHWRDGEFHAYTVADGLPHNYVKTLLRGRAGQIWVGTEMGLATWDEGRIRPVLPGAQSPEVDILDLYEDEENRLWIATFDDGLVVFDGDSIEPLEAPDELDGIAMWSLAPDPAGGIWVATNGQGAFLFGRDRVRKLSTDDGLVNNFVWQVFVDGDKRLWLYTNRGLDRWDGTSFVHFDIADGLLDLEGSVDGIVQDGNGNIWFGSGRGLVKYTPRHELPLKVAPSVFIDGAAVGGEPFPSPENGPIEVDYAQGPVSFSFAGLTFHDETTTEYRYRLLGLTDEWSPFTPERSVSYAQLPPGDYTFEVETRSAHGSRSEVPAQLSFTVKPSVFQTMWFRVSVSLSVVGMLVAVYWGRHRHVELEKRRLAETVRMRTSELAKSEERMRTALRNSPTFVFSQDRELRYTWVHNPILELKPTDVLGSTDADLLDPETAQELTTIKQSVLDTGKGLRQQIIVRRGDMDRHLDLTIEPLLEDDEIVGVTGAAWDVSKQVVLESQLRQSQKLEAVGQLAGGVAHDFNNLLTGITGYTQLALAHLSGDSPAAGECENVLDCSKRAAQLTQQLLAFSRRQPLEFDVLNLNELIGRTSTLLRRVIGEDIELIVACSPELSNVHADAGQIEQVLVNLAVNARDAMPEGGKLVITTSDVVLDSKIAREYAGALPGAYTKVAVTDTGTGMAEATRERAFEPFFTTKEVGRGTGLGLATVYGIVKQHDGFVYIHSEVGEGTTIEVFLPPTDESVDVHQDTADAAMPGGGETILLVEDEKAVRDVTSRWLENLGYKIYVAEDPDEASVIYEAHAEEIDLLFTDVVMPRSSGPELYKNISGKQASLRVLYMSGYANRGGTSHDLNRPGIEFLQKPFSLDELANKVRSVLDDSVAA